MQFFSPWGFLALLGIPIIVLLYMIKQKYTDAPVSSLFLWKAAIANTQSQKHWQKLRKNLLMALQILAVTLLALALANPYMMRGEQKADYILAIDCSMSMQATDVSPSRLEGAKTAALEMVKNAPPDTAFTLVKVAQSPQVLFTHTTNRSQIMDAIKALTPTNGGANWEGAEALLAAQKQQLGGDIYLFTDRHSPTETPLANVSLFANGGENCAITHLSHNQGEQGYQSLVQVKNFGKKEANRTVTLFLDGVPFDIVELTLAPGEERDVVFSGISLDTRAFLASISPEDILAADDLAYDAAAGTMKNKALLVSEGSVFLEKGLAILPNMDFYKTSPNVDEDLSGYALYIFDGVLPTQLPQDGHILVFNLPKENAIASLFELEDKDVTVHGQGRGALSFMNQAQFLVSKPLGMEVPVWGEKILDYGGNAIGVAGEQNGRKMVLFSFGLNQSDFPLKKEFPILLYELTNWYFPQSVTMTGSALADQAIALPLLPNAVSAEIALPNGEIVVAADTQPAPLFEETGQVGVYTLTQVNQAGGKTESRFAVNPQITGESDALWPVADEAAAAEQETVQKSKSLQRGILLVLLLLLLIEWRVSLHEN